MKMFFIFLFFISFTFCSCREIKEDEEILNYVNSYGYRKFNYFIDKKIEKNFTNSKHREILVFFTIEGKKNKNDKGSDFFVLVFNNKNHIEMGYRFPHINYCDNRNFIKEVNKFEKIVNEGIFYDFNQNGKTELIVFSADGSTYDFKIIEFKGDVFQNIAPRFLSNCLLDHFDFEEKSMYMHSIDTGERIKLTWNSERQRYFYEEY